jgi:hypothetical protein
MKLFDPVKDFVEKDFNPIIQMIAAFILAGLPEI